MRMFANAMLLTTIVALSGCYHAVITTSRQPSGQTIERAWAHSFIAGLVPPSVTETASQCPNGVARVETRHSFLNMVAQAVTFSIYSPMTILVQCAGGDEDDAAAGGASPLIEAGEGGAQRAMQEAVRRSARTGTPVYVDLH